MSDVRIADPAPPALSEAALAELRLLEAKIQESGRFNCSVYKDRCLRRRLMVRMRARGTPSFAAYAALLDHDAVEWDSLLDALTVNVTRFFRNPETWAEIEAHVVPVLFAGAPLQPRIWSAGCSSGEEPYTAAILLLEWARRSGRTAELRRCRVEGTDIDRASLAAAAGAAAYPPHAMPDVPPAIRQRWFGAGPPYRLDEHARRLVSFRRHDLVSDPPGSGYGLILCRNVMIYFERETQLHILQRFHDALLPGGFLVLGKAETLHGALRPGFEVVNGRERIFRKRAG